MNAVNEKLFYSNHDSTGSSVKLLSLKTSQTINFMEFFFLFLYYDTPCGYYFVAGDKTLNFRTFRMHRSISVSLSSISVAFEIAFKLLSAVWKKKSKNVKSSIHEQNFNITYTIFL